jgi:hypothetical protein
LVDGLPLEADLVQIGDVPVVTDVNGAATVLVSPYLPADIQSAQQGFAISHINGFEISYLEGTGAEIRAFQEIYGAGIILIEGQALIHPDDVYEVCYDPSSNSMQFPYRNDLGAAITVSSGYLNYIDSITGGAAPATTFEATEEGGYSYFAASADHFKYTEPGSGSEFLIGKWSVFNDETEFNTLVTEFPLCPGPGELDGCESANIDELLDRVVSTVTSLSKQAARASSGGRFKNPYLKAASRVIKKFKNLTRYEQGDALICPAEVPEGCQLVRLPKKKLGKVFDRLFDVKLPREYRFLESKYARHQRRFDKLLKQKPDEYVMCPK